MEMETRYGVRAAVTWRIIAELFRRHKQACRLRVLETHPGGGQYDCLSVGFNRGEVLLVHMCDFNVGSQHLHLTHPYAEPRARLQDLGWPNFNDYVVPFLCAEDPKEVVDQVEALLGLPACPGLPPTTPPTLVCRVIAGVMERYAFSRTLVTARCAWHDSSGFEGCYVEPWIASFPELQARIDALPDDDDWRKVAAVAGRLWRLKRKDAETMVIVDMGTAEAIWTGEPGARVSLWEMFTAAKRDPDAAVDWICQRL